MPFSQNHSAAVPFIGLSSLMRMATSGENIAQFVKIAASKPDDANMLMSLSIILQLTGNREMGLELQDKALKLQQLYHLPCPAPETALRLLALLTPGDVMDNTPIDFLLEGSDIALDLLYVSPEMPISTSLPDHDALIVAIGQSDQNQALLAQVDQFIKQTSHPILNTPNHIARLSRDSVSKMLQSVPGLEVPLTARVERQDLLRLGRGEEIISSLLKDGIFPIIVRPLNSHGGKGLARIESPVAIADYLNIMPDEEFFIARFVDYRGSDGCYHKSRLALISGQPYACHLAISDNWMIHYKNTGMAESAHKRAEEARFMADFDQDFALRHKPALCAIAERLGLDYLVIDCGQTTDGKLLLFEADNLGLIHALDPVDIYPYKQPQMQKVFYAFQEMLRNRIRRNVR